jgi:hypothetical protein
MAELSLDNILDDNEAETLFDDMEDSQEGEKETEEGNASTADDGSTGKNKNKTTEVNAEKLFSDSPESVGSGDNEDNEEKEDTSSEEEEDASTTNFYPSIAKALKEDGVLPDLDYKTVKTPEDFAKAIDEVVKSQLSEGQRRVLEALDANVEPDDIRKYENTLNYLDSIKEEDIVDENKGEALRKQLIYQDYINRGYKKERAQREVEKSINGGTDIEDAKEALASNREYFNNAYNDLVEDAKAQEEEAKAKMQEQAEALKKSILEDQKIFGDLVVDKVTRKQIFDNISKPVYKDPKTGNLYTAIQKYQMDNGADFIKNLGLVFTLTKGFTDFNGLVKGRVKQEMNKNLRELEHRMKSARPVGGSLNYMSGESGGSDSGWDLDI